MYRLHLALVIALSAATVGCVSPSPPAVRWLDDSLIYHPSPYPQGNWNPQGLAAEDAFFSSADGTKLHGWYCPSPNPRAVVLVAHGNAGNLSDRAPMMRLLQQRLGTTAMIFDYRGYGRSEGLPSEKGVLADARAARAWLARRAGVPEREVVLLGRSLGGGVMVDLAARDGARALILESTFTSLPDVAAQKLPYTPVRYLMRNRLNSLSKIEQFEGPLLQSHGDADRLIPLENARRLFAAAPGRKQFIVIPGAGHNWAPAEEYIGQLDRFIASLDN